ncbi:hypothetical protein G8759_23830 [Spirosoma aureum]|uniref:Uncharacterized protein n=1 Tax=Spirosoma aureum TaxID=2692134 RepID=A0A6G9ASZ2_9BACT|nr:hypothetical protein [Spirosoma aureum]QIP15446.1 hypothetical protein G8759_23830 [Spirosoma aureum]
MKKLVSFGLFFLLLCHTLAHVIAGLSAWWQEEHDLSTRLQVYRSVDSIVEFQIPLVNKTDGTVIVRTTEDGFNYRGHYYNVVSLEVQGDTLHIAGLESTSRSFWQDDLLTFVNHHLTSVPATGGKASQLLKLLLKEYSPSPRTVLHFLFLSWRESIRIPDTPLVFSTRSEPIYSPPPELTA